MGARHRARRVWSTAAIAITLALGGSASAVAGPSLPGVPDWGVAQLSGAWSTPTSNAREADGSTTPAAVRVGSTTSATLLDARAAAALLESFRAQAAAAPVTCNLEVSLLAAVVAARPSALGGEGATATVARQLCAGARDLSDPRDLRAGLWAVDPSPAFAGLVATYRSRYVRLGLDRDLTVSELTSPELVGGSLAATGLLPAAGPASAPAAGDLGAAAERAADRAFRQGAREEARQEARKEARPEVSPSAKPSPSGSTPGTPAARPSGTPTPAEPSGSPANPSGSPADPSGSPAEPSGSPAKPSGSPAKPAGSPATDPEDKPTGSPAGTPTGPSPTPSPSPTPTAPGPSVPGDVVVCTPPTEGATNEADAATGDAEVTCPPCVPPTGTAAAPDPDPSGTGATAGAAASPEPGQVCAPGSTATATSPSSGQ